MAKRRKHIRKNAEDTWKIADSEIFPIDTVHCRWSTCGRNALRMPIYKYRSVALRMRIICPPLVLGVVHIVLAFGGCHCSCSRWHNHSIVGWC